MKNQITACIKHSLLLFFLFTGANSFQLIAASPLTFHFVVDQQDAQYFVDLTITIDFVDGTQAITKVKELGNNKHQVWSKTYDQPIKRIHLKAKMYTTDLFGPVKILIDSYLEDIEYETNFTLTLGGTYQRPYVGKSFKGSNAEPSPFKA